jgi:hypothetical protein
MKGRNPMKKADVQIGHTYECKVSGKLVPVRIQGVADFGGGPCGWNGVNLSTGREIHVRGPKRLRREILPPAPPA